MQTVKRCVAWIASGAVLYMALHYVATMQRGYEAVGGEACAFIVTVLGVAIALYDRGRA